MQPVTYKKGPVTVTIDERGLISYKLKRFRFPNDSLVFDDQGLPVYSWIDARSKLPRSCFLIDDPYTQGDLRFVHMNANHGRRGGLETIAVAGALIILYLIVVKSMWLIVLFSGIAFWGIRVFAPAIGKDLGRLIAWTRPRYSMAPWSALTEFEVTNVARAYGDLKNVEFAGWGKENKLYSDMSVILAHFGMVQDSIDVLRGNWTPQAVTGFHRVLTQEFIMRREAHLLRLAKKTDVVKNVPNPAAPPLWRKPVDKVASAGN